MTSANEESNIVLQATSSSGAAGTAAIHCITASPGLEIARFAYLEAVQVGAIHLQ
jgi:hypothetical protein